MPFIAQIKNETVNSLQFSERDWEHLKRNQKSERTCKCVECGFPLIPRSYPGGEVHPHFYHASPQGNTNSICTFTNESQEHVYLKARTYEISNHLQLKIETEVKIGRQRADIVFPDHKKIIEFQLTSQEPWQYRKRTNAYQAAGYETLWVSWKPNNIPPMINFVSVSNINNKKEIIGSNLNIRKVVSKLDKEGFHKNAYAFKNPSEFSYTIAITDKLENLIQEWIGQKTFFNYKCPIHKSGHWEEDFCVNEIFNFLKDPSIQASYPKQVSNISNFFKEHLENIDMATDYPSVYRHLDNEIDGYSGINQHIRPVEREKNYNWREDNYYSEKSIRERIKKQKDTE